MKYILISLLLLISVSLTANDKRLALVLANESYQHMELDYPVSNADGMEMKLAELGFEVDKLTNLSQSELRMAIDGFGKKLNEYDVGLVYYSGLAVKAKGSNYIIPVDANPESENDVEYSCVNLGRVLASMEDACIKTIIVIIDASEDNILERRWTQAVVGHGLTFMDGPDRAIIAYSTLPGNITSITKGNNSLYTSALIDAMGKPNISLEDTFKEVRLRVRNESEGKQIPWISTSLVDNFYFVTNDDFEEQIYNIEAAVKTSEIVAARDLLPVFTDNRDGKEYSWVKIGRQTWMAENINYYIEDDSWCYGNVERNCDTYGRLYNYKAALKACPDGWHLPSDEEFKILEIEIGMSRTDADKRDYFRGTIQGGRLKDNTSGLWDDPNTGAVDDVGFKALPGGWRDSNGVFDKMHMWSFFWSSTEQTQYCAWARVLLHDNNTIERFNMIQDWGFGVRCVKDLE